MRNYLILWLLAAFFLTFSQSFAEDFEHLFTPVRHYVVFRAAEPLVIDGKPDEPSWKKAEWSDDFIDIEGDSKPKPLYQTRFKMLWDEDNLYIFAELEEPHVWAYYQERDMIVYHENDFEIFIDPDGNAHDYFEFEINACNTLFDLFMPRPYRDGARPFVVYDAKGLESAVFVDGTLNDPSDVDKKWCVEVKIPFADLRTGESVQLPKDGQTWRINFSRVQWQSNVVDGRYVRRRDPDSGRLLPENNWVWSAPGIISMHAPERYGMVQFSTHAAGTADVDFQTTNHQLAADCAWLIYYSQKAYHSQHNTYAGSLAELGLADSLPLENNGKVAVDLAASRWQFTAVVTESDGSSCSINETGLFHVK